MAITLQYRTTRQAINAFYWRAWRRRLWMFHAIILTAGIGLTVWSWHEHKADLFSPLIFTLCAIVLMILYPQLNFKPQLRTLIIDADGIQTTIGKKSGVRSWAEIASIEEVKSAIVVTTRAMNAFIIPDSAFDSTDGRADTLMLMRRWHAEASGNLPIAPL